MKTNLFLILNFIFAILFSKFAHSGEFVTLDSLIKIAKENNKEIIAARRMWDAAKSRVVSERTWDKPKFSVEYQNMHEGGFDLQSAPEKMYGITQMIPFPGKLAVKGKIANFEAQTMEWEYKYSQLKVLSELKKTFAMYYYINKSIDTYRQTSDIMKNYSLVAESRYVVGKLSQSDVLRAQVEAEKMSNMIVTLEQEKATVQAELNLLLGKDVDERLGEPEDLSVASTAMDWDKIKNITLKNSPEIAKSNSKSLGAKWTRKSALMEYLPDFDVSLKRKTMNSEWAGSDFMVGFTMPLWFWSQASSVQQMSYELNAAESEKRNIELMTLSKAKKFYTKLDASRRLLELYRTSVLPKSEQSLKVAESSYNAGRLSFLELLDTVRSFLEFKLDYYGNISQYHKDLAELETIAGVEL